MAKALLPTPDGPVMRTNSLEWWWWWWWDAKDASSVNAAGCLVCRWYAKRNCSIWPPFSYNLPLMLHQSNDDDDTADAIFFFFFSGDDDDDNGGSILIEEATSDSFVGSGFWKFICVVWWCVFQVVYKGHSRSLHRIVVSACGTPRADVAVVRSYYLRPFGSLITTHILWYSETSLQKIRCGIHLTWYQSAGWWCHIYYLASLGQDQSISCKCYLSLPRIWVVERLFVSDVHDWGATNSLWQESRVPGDHHQRF